MIKSPDEYSILVETGRGSKEFQFDQIFTEQTTQEKVFEDTYVSIFSVVKPLLLLLSFNLTLTSNVTIEYVPNYC